MNRMNRMIYIPQAIANCCGVPQQLGERRFRRLFPDAPIVEESQPGQWRADWSAYQAVFDADSIEARFNRARQEKEWARHCAEFTAGRPADSFVYLGHPEVTLDARCRAQAKLAAQQDAPAAALP